MGVDSYLGQTDTENDSPSGEPGSPDGRCAHQPVVTIAMRCALDRRMSERSERTMITAPGAHVLRVHP